MRNSYVRRSFVAVLVALLMQPALASAGDRKLANLKSLLLEARAASDSVSSLSAGNPAGFYDRNDLAIQNVRVHMLADCEAGLKTIGQRPEIGGFALRFILDDVRSYEAVPCRIAIARLALDRSEDRNYTPQGRIALRFELGAELSALQAPDAKAIMDDAQRRLHAESGFEGYRALLSARFTSLKFFDGPRTSQFLDETAPLLKDRRSFFASSSKDGFLAIFAREGRCDLITLVEGEGSCPKFVALSQTMYGPASGPGWLATAFRDPLLVDITPNQAGLRKAMTGELAPGKLVLFAKRVREEMAVIGRAAASQATDRGTMERCDQYDGKR